jgi:hypothetical protein
MIRNIMHAYSFALESKNGNVQSYNKLLAEKEKYNRRERKGRQRKFLAVLIIGYQFRTIIFIF